MNPRADYRRLKRTTDASQKMPRRLEIRRHPASLRQRKSCNRSYGRIACLFHIDRISSLASCEWAARISVFSERPSVRPDNIKCWPIAFTFRSYRYGPAVRQRAYPNAISFTDRIVSNKVVKIPVRIVDRARFVSVKVFIARLLGGIRIHLPDLFLLFFSFASAKSTVQSDASLSCKVLCGRPHSRSAE